MFGLEGNRRRYFVMNLPHFVASMSLLDTCEDHPDVDH
jgi:hypothetical protein